MSKRKAMERLEEVENEILEVQREANERRKQTHSKHLDKAYVDKLLSLELELVGARAALARYGDS